MINTHSKFIYGFSIDSDNFAIDFDEGAGEIQASIPVGEYTFGEIATEMASVMTEAGTQEYSVNIDRTNRLITIFAAAPFDLLTLTGSRFGKSAFTLLGFVNPADFTGTNTYTSLAAAGYQYNTQMRLQDYISSEDFRQSASAVVNKTASGSVEVIKFGEEKFMQCNFRFITDYFMAKASPVRNNPTGKQDFLDFIRFMTTKGFAEFLPDENNASEFEKLILESTTNNKDGVGYKLDEQYEKGLPGFYDSGQLVFRVAE